MKNINVIKNIQYSLFIFSIILLILSIVFIEIGFIKPFHIGYKNKFSYLIFIFQNFNFNFDNISMYVILQIGCLSIFFGIAIYIGLKLLPIPLSEMEINKIIISPYNSFNGFMFKKILFGSVVSISNDKFDFRGHEFSRMADLYLFHFKVSNKRNGLLLIFIIVFVFPLLLDMEYEYPIYLLIMSFVHVNLLLLLLLELILFVYGNYIKSKNHD